MAGFTPPDAIVNRVLIVEDDREEAAFLRDYLERQGMTVEVARDGGQAHASFSMHLPDFVLLDVLLPNVSGFEVCEQLKRINDSVPIAFLTGVDMDDARDLARRVGADDYVTKPYDPDELLATIHAVSNTVWSRVHEESDATVDGGKIRFECGECGKRMKVSSAHRGRTLNCPKCGQSVIVPRHA